MTNEPTNDILEPKIEQALRTGFRDGTIATPEFSRRCSDVGMQAFRRRELIQKIREPASPVDYKLTLPAYVQELVFASGVSKADAEFALGLAEDENWSSLNQLNASTKETVELLRIDKHYARDALVIPTIGLPAIAHQDNASVVRDLAWARSEIRQHINDALNGADISLAARVEQRQKDVEEFFSS